MIPCGKRFVVEAAVRGFRCAQRPVEIFPVGKLGESGRPAFQQPLLLRGDWRWWGNTLLGSAEANGLPSSSPYSYAVTGGGGATCSSGVRRRAGCQKAAPTATR